MVDTRFHPSAGPISLGDLLARIGISIGLDDREARLIIEGAEELETAGPVHLALAASKDYVAQLRATSAGAVLVSAKLLDDVPAGATAIVCDRPHEAFADALDLLYPANTRSALGGLPNGADPAPFLEDGVELGPNVVLGHNVEIGRGTVIGANTVIGSGVAIGRNVTVAANCTIECAYIGNGVVIHAGARIGTEGFGWLDHGRSNRKIPQLGRAIIQDNVEIGANTTIDRGALGDTVIGQGTKIDNLVQIGHNCRIGRYCLIAAQSGLSGSTTLEDGVLVGGGAGTAGHLVVGARTIVRGMAGVMRSVPAGGDVCGIPARDTREYWREVAVLRRLAKKEGRNG